MKKEKKEILDGVIVDLSKMENAYIEKFINAFEDILSIFPGNEKISIRWSSQHPSNTNKVITNIATCEDQGVDAENPKLYEYIFSTIYN